jgi:hypothetical protein
MIATVFYATRQALIGLSFFSQSRTDQVGLSHDSQGCQPQTAHFQ